MVRDLWVVKPKKEKEGDEEEVVVHNNISDMDYGCCYLYTLG